MDVGLYTDSLSGLPFEHALDVAAEAGIRSIEIATGGQSSAPHLPLEELLASPERRRDFLQAFSAVGSGSPPSIAPRGRCIRSRGRPRALIARTLELAASSA